jgi:peptidoglycan/LPS O-acetylase OafA/YrhL
MTLMQIDGNGGNGRWQEKESDSALAVLTRVGRQTLEILRPAILTRGPRKQLKPTAYLDGLRGFAAFMVYWQHHQVWARVGLMPEIGNVLENAYGYEDKYYLVCLPFLRTFFAGGHFAVAVFFVISGYVLSAKPLTLIQAREYLKLEDSVASALFRRWMRLYIPSIATTFLFMASWHAFGIWTAFPPHQSNFREELWNYYAEFKNFSFVFRVGGHPWFTYNFHLWSIPVEFRGSIAIYTTQIALARCSRNARLLLQAGLIFYFLFIVDGWSYASFITGMLICDLELLAKQNNLPSFFTMLQPYKRLLACTFCFIGIYLGGVPASNPDILVLRRSPGWYYLSFLTPEAVNDYKFFFLYWAASFLVATTPHIPWLKSFFESRFNQYLGRISFALYLVHGPVLWTISDRLYLALGWARENNIEGLLGWMNLYPMQRSGIFGLELAFLLPHIIILPLTLWAAEITTKLFDEPSIKFPHWAYRRALKPQS